MTERYLLIGALLATVAPFWMIYGLQAKKPLKNGGKIMAKIIPNPGLPQLGTAEFYQWLHDFHAAHNNVAGKCTPASDTEVIQVTDEAEIIYPVGYRVTEKGEQAVQEYRETQKMKLAS